MKIIRKIQIRIGETWKIHIHNGKNIRENSDSNSRLSFFQNPGSTLEKIQVQNLGKSGLNIRKNQVQNWENKDPNSLNIVGEKLNNFFTCISQNKYLIADLITGKFIRKRIVNHI